MKNLKLYAYKFQYTHTTNINTHPLTKPAPFHIHFDTKYYARIFRRLVLARFDAHMRANGTREGDRP